MLRRTANGSVPPTEHEEEPSETGDVMVSSARPTEDAAIIESLEAPRQADGLSDLESQFDSFVTAHTALEARRKELQLQLRSAETQLAALNERAQRLSSLLENVQVTR